MIWRTFGRARRASKLGAPAYDAFISYSRALDGRLAPALQDALHRFTKPWYRLRALRVFRDDASLSANPGLWPSIEQALASSRYFILLASPEAARSRWVAREADYWGRHKPLTGFLLVLTDGELVWDEATRDFDWTRTTALPPSLKGIFDEEPRYIDLRWARNEEHLSLDDPRFRDGVADLSAPLHGQAKDELFGEDVRQHRRTVRLARSAIASLATLAVLASTAAVIAVDRGNRATEQARRALSRQLAAEATAAADDQLDLALVLAAQAYAIRPTAQSKSSLLQVLLRSPYLVGYLAGTAGTTRLAFEPRGRVLAVGQKDGEVALWDALKQRKLKALPRAHRAEVTALALSRDGHRLISGAADGTVSVWDTSTGSLRTRYVGEPIRGVTFDAGGARAAAASENTATVVWDAATGKRLHKLPFDRFGDMKLTFVGGETLAVGDMNGKVEFWNLGTKPPRRTEGGGGGGMPFVSAYSRDMRFFSGWPIHLERPYLVDVASGEFLPDLRGPTVAVGGMDFSGDGHILATAGDGRVVLWDTAKREALPEVLAGMPGETRTRTSEEGRPLAVAVSYTGRRVAAAGGRGVAVWDRGAHSLLRELQASGAQPQSEVPNVARGGASATFSPDSRLLAWSIWTSLSQEGNQWVVVWDLARDREVLRFPSSGVVGFSPDGSRVAGAGFSEEERFIVTDLDTGERKQMRTLPWKVEQQRQGEPPSGQLWTVANTGGLGASAAFDGTVTLWDVERRQALGTVRVPGAFDFSYLTFDSKGRTLAVATAGGALSLVEVAPDAWRAHACMLAARDLTVEERRLYLSGQEVPRACP
jgi:WD40 repeat protein